MFLYIFILCLIINPIPIHSLPFLNNTMKMSFCLSWTLAYVCTHTQTVNKKQNIINLTSSMTNVSFTSQRTWHSTLSSCKLLQIREGKRQHEEKMVAYLSQQSHQLKVYSRAVPLFPPSPLHCSVKTHRHVHLSTSVQIRVKINFLEFDGRMCKIPCLTGLRWDKVQDFKGAKYFFVCDF